MILFITKGTTRMKSSKSADLQAILKIIKKILKSRKLSYANVAQDMGVSEISIKRLFSSDNPSLKNLLSICDLLNISFLEVATIAKENSNSEYILNKRQDEFFFENPRLYALFIDLYRRTSPDDVKKYWKLTEAEYFKTLRKYEKLEMIELYPNNHFKFNMTGIIRALPNGKLRTIFFEQNLDFLAHVQTSSQTSSQASKHLLQISEILLSEENIKSLTRDLEELGQKYRAKAFTDETILAANDTKSIRLLIAMAPYQTDWRKY